MANLAIIYDMIPGLLPAIYTELEYQLCHLVFKALGF